MLVWRNNNVTKPMKQYMIVGINALYALDIVTNCCTCYAEDCIFIAHT